MIRLQQGLRVLGGLALATLVGLAAASPYLPAAATAAALATFAVALWRPGVALAFVVGLVPAGMLLAPDPVRAAEMMAWAFLAGFLLRVDRPLASRGLPRFLLIPASLYLVCVISSWLSLTIAEAGGIDSSAMLRFVLHAIGTDHLSATSPEPETSAMLLSATGVALFLSASALAGAQPRLVEWAAGAFAVCMAALGAAAIGSVFLQWQARDFAGWFIARFATIERVAVHIPDVNAAGSQYVMALLAATGLAVQQRSRRPLWAALSLPMAIGLFLTGSRTAALTTVVAFGVFVAARQDWRPRVRHVVVSAVMLGLLVGTVGMVLARGGDAQNSAARAMRLRAAFSETSARMTASAPVFGVGIGRFHGRSGEFMPADLKAVFGSENAHNYFAQQFAELGVVGGVIFAWLIWSGLRGAWGARTLSWVHAGVFAGVLGYTITCLTGHPLLVPEAALPFWPLLGAASAPTMPAARRRWRSAAAPATAAALILLVSIGTAPMRYGDTSGRERGFYPPERDQDGATFRWMTRHGVTFVDAVPGFLTITAQAAEVGPRPFELVVEVDGRERDRRVIPPRRWTTITLPVRPSADSDATVQRVDLRASHTWAKQEGAAEQPTTVPVSLMVRIDWAPAR